MLFLRTCSLKDKNDALFFHGISCQFKLDLYLCAADEAEAGSAGEQPAKE